MKKLIVVAMVLGLVSIASAADTTWTAGTGDWNNADNWSGGLPKTSTVAAEQLGAVIDASTAVVNVTGTGANAHRLMMGNAAAGTPTLNVYGELNVLGAYAAVGKIAGVNAVMNVYDGADIVAKGLCVADAGTGTLNMYGGTFQVGTDNTLYMGIAGVWQNAGTGVVNLYDGTLDISRTLGFRMATHGSANALLNIAGGELIVAGNVTDLRSTIMSTFSSRIVLQANGVAYENDSGFVYSYNSANNTTTVTAIPEPATIALLGFGGLALIRRKR